jgi:hypothetical protein
MEKETNAHDKPRVIQTTSPRKQMLLIQKTSSAYSPLPRRERKE